MSVFEKGFNPLDVVYRLKTADPEACRIFFPRRYRNIERFHDYRLVNVHWCAYNAACKKRLIRLPVEDEVALTVISAIAAKWDFPVFFVAPEMFLAVTQTTVPDKIDWETMHLPFDSMTFVLPKGIAKVEGHEVAGVQFTRALEGKYVAPRSLAGVMLSRNTLFIDIALANGARLFSRILTPYEHTQQLTVITTENEFAANVTANETGMIKLLTNSVFNLIYAMAARPELVSKPVKRSGIHKKTQTEIWDPRIIGEHFTVARPRGDVGATHASPRLHWRRGHFRRQRIGEMRTAQKLIWIEPCLVGVRSAG